MMFFRLSIFYLAWAVLLGTQTQLASAWPTIKLPHFKSVKPQSYYAERNLNTIQRIYNLTVYPNQVPIVAIGGAAAVPKGLFSKKVVGRVDPVGNFTGFEHSIEYFFALSPLPQANAARAAITHAKITEFQSQCKDTASSVVYLYCSVFDPGAPDHGKPLPPLKQVAFWKFDDEGAVLKYDAWIPNLNSWVEMATGARISDLDFQVSSITQICATTQMLCTGSNRQWDSIPDCVTTLLRKRYGTYDEAWGDNVVCRTIHLVLTQVRPDVHCPHVGPTGGGKCVDVQYPENYFSDERLYGEPVGQTFVCEK